MKRRFNFRAYIEISDTNLSTWVAHCLEVDIISWGGSPAQAKAMLQEAVELCLSDDILNALDPLHRPAAPVDVWESWRRLPETDELDLSIGEPVGPIATRLSCSFDVPELRSGRANCHGPPSSQP